MAKVLSSISGNLISAASAGFAPTNSGDVSAIASAYQVVSATATQLYVGTAFLTSVNGAPVSASRAENAANASMANSAYYDGTGRLISALPDSAAVSSIASSYAESAASGKADSSSLSSYALSSDVSGVIDTVSTNSASWGAGISLPITGSTGDDSASYEAGRLEFTRYDTAGEPDIRTATLTPDSLWMDYTLDGNDHTSMTLNESMLVFGDSEGDHIVDAYSIDTWNSAVDTVANNSASWGGAVDSATVSAIASSYAESAVSSKLDTTAQVVSSTAGDGTYITSINGMGISGQGGGGGGVVTATGSASATEGWWPVTTAYLVSSINGSAILPYGFSSVSANSANWNSTRTTVLNNSANWTSTRTTVLNNSANWTSTRITVLNNSANWTSVYDTVYSNSASWTGSTGETQVVTSTASGVVVTGFITPETAISGINGSALIALSAKSAYNAYTASNASTAQTALYDANGRELTSIGTATGVDSATVSAIASAYQVVSSVGDDGTYITSINGSALSGAGGGVDSATVSAIASSYAESAVSSKLDTTAFNSGDFYSTSNPSGFITGVDLSNYATTAYVDSSVSSKLDTTAFNSGDFYTTANESGYVDSAYVDSAVSSKMDKSAIDYTRTEGGTQIYASGTGASTNQFSAKNDSAGAAIIAGTYARVRLWDSAATGNIYASSISTWNNKMDGSAVQSAYASASATQATANGVLYILIPDGA